MSVFPYAFHPEHAAMSRLDGPVGSEIRRLESDFEALRAEYTTAGAVDATTIEQLRDGLDRLNTQGELLELADVLMEHAGHIRGMVTELANDKAPGALDRTARHLAFQIEQIQAVLDSRKA
ncbi:hypothetical protein [Streptomyces werraensis]|uniref:hypothetical protein n=1 Tax=Streptomyces werraensis TaxID=68284 RepID=UPI003444D9CD